ncbi:MAG TPA: ParB N-terminal domain-containing protein [Nitrospiraceae bacterium]|nr:ParB N-terminal domain-containing protein [Nitrospiraceae bacterium]
MLPKSRPDTKPLSWIKPGSNSRPVTIDDGIKNLWASIEKNGLLQRVGVIDRAEDNLIYGFRRYWAHVHGKAETIDVDVYPADITPLQVGLAQGVENLARKDNTPPEIYAHCKKLLTLCPELKLGDLALHLGVSPGMVTQYVCPDKLMPEALESFLRGDFGFGAAYDISRAKDQLAALSALRNGASREDRRRANREPKAKAATVVTKSVTVILDGGLTATFRDDRGVTLQSVSDLSPEIKKLVDDAIKRDHDAKTFAALMKKKAKALKK